MFFCDREGFGSPVVVVVVEILSADLASLPSCSPVELVAVIFPVLLLLSRGLARHFPLLVAPVEEDFLGVGREVSLDRGVDFPKSMLYGDTLL